MTSVTTAISLDVYVNLEPLKDGQVIISSSTYIGNADSPLYLHESKFSDILQEYIDSNTIPNGTIHGNTKIELVQLLNQMKVEIDKQIIAVENIPNY